MKDYNNFIFYGSWRNTFEGFRKEFGDAYAYEALWNLMMMGTGGDYETEKQSIIGFLEGSCLPNILASRDKYEKAKNGGRPSKIGMKDDEEIALLRHQGKTQAEIAKIFGVSEKTIQRRDGWKYYYEFLPDKTGQKDLSSCQRDGQNWTGQEVKKSKPYIDIYKDIKPLSLEAKRQSSPPLEPKWKIEDLEE